MICIRQTTSCGSHYWCKIRHAEHREDNARVFDVKLDPQDISLIDSITAKSNDLFDVIGDCGGKYR